MRWENKNYLKKSAQGRRILLQRVSLWNGPSNGKRHFITLTLVLVSLNKAVQIACPATMNRSIVFPLCSHLSQHYVLPCCVPQVPVSSNLTRIERDVHRRPFYTLASLVLFKESLIATRLDDSRCPVTFLCHSRDRPLVKERRTSGGIRLSHRREVHGPGICQV